MTPFQIFGQGSIPPPSRVGAPRSRFPRPALPGDMEATAPFEDLNLQLVTRTLPSDDESHAPSPVSGSHRELPNV